MQNNKGPDSATFPPVEVNAVVICDHIIGLSISRMLHNDGTQRLEWKDEVTASWAQWKDDGIVQIWWDGPRYRYCPLCGKDLGVFVTGLRSI